MKQIILFASLFIIHNCIGQELIVPIGHTNFIYSLSFSPDGRQLVSASADKTTRVWDLSTGKLIKKLTDHGEFVTNASYTHDGKLLVTASFDSTVIIWNSTDLSPLHKIKLPTGRMSGFRISPDDRFLATISENDRRTVNGNNMLISGNESVNIFDLNTGKLLHRLDSVWGNIRYYEFSGHSNLLTTVIRVWDDFDKSHNEILLWNLSTGHLFRKFNGRLAAMGTGDQLIIDSAGFLRAVDVITGNMLWNQPGAFTESKGLVSIVNGNRFIEYTWDSLKVRSASTGDILSSLEFTRDVENVESDRPGRYFTVRAGTENIIYDSEELRSVDTVEATIMGTPPAFSPQPGVFAYETFEEEIIVRTIGRKEKSTILRGHTSAIRDGKYSPDGKYILLLLQQPDLLTYTVSVWRTSHLLPAYQISFDKEIICSRFFGDGSRFTTVTKEGEVEFWVSATGERDSGIHLEKYLLSDIDIDTAGKKYAFTENYSIVFGDLAKGKMPETITDGIKYQFAALSPDGMLLAAHSGNGIISLWRTSDKKLLYRRSSRDDPYKVTELNTSFFNAEVIPIQFSSDGKFFVSVSVSGPVRIWNSTNGKLIVGLHSAHSFITANFNGDNTLLITTRYPGVCELWDARTGKFIRNLIGHESDINSARFSNTGSTVITASYDNTARIWETGTGNQKLLLFPVNKAGYFTQIPSGHYQASKDASKLLHYSTKDLRIINFEQLDVKFNRPDLVLREMGSDDTAMILSYERAYKKRVAKLGIDTSAFTSGFILPEADFSNRKQIPDISKDSLLTLTIHAKSETSLDRFHIWIDETPLFGMKGISLRSRDIKQFDTTITIQLSRGENHIETSVTSKAGIESFRSPVVVQYPGSPVQKEKLHFIGIGINRFQQPGQELRWSVKDIRDLALSLKEKYGDDISVDDTLFDDNVTISRVLALKTKLQQTSVNDKVIIAYSGHGLLSNDYDYYLSTYNVNFSNPQLGGLPYEMLESLLDSIPSRKKLMLIDACHSGEVDKEEMEKYVIVEKTLEDSGTRSSRKPVPGDGKLGMKNSFELMQELFVNVSRSTGATVISAAAGTQFARESSKLQNGVFTFAILEYMRSHPTATVSELRNYVNKRVSEVTQGLQVPTTRSETRSVDWKVW